MKYLLISAVAIFIVYVVFLGGHDYPEVRVPDGSQGAILFAADGCGRHCSAMRKYLGKRMEFLEYDAFDDGEGSAMYKEYGGSRYVPYVVIGEERVVGNNPGGVISAIAIEYGPANLHLNERRALAANFDSDGEPRVIMYATSWCGYCVQAREYFAKRGVELVEYDIERDPVAKRDFDTLMGHGTPLLYYGYARVSGFNAAEVQQKFEL